MKNIMKKIMYLAFALGALAMMFFPESWEALGLIATAGSLTMAVAVPGTVTVDNVEDAAAGHTARSISQIVTEVKPDDFALDTILRSIRKAEQIQHVKHEYEAVTFRGREDQLGAAFVQAGGIGDASTNITVDNVNIWAADDTVYVPEVPGSDGQPLRLHVESVDVNGGTLKVTAINGQAGNLNYVMSMPDNTLIKRLGNAKDETASETGIITQLPSSDYNYAQIQMCLIERSKVSAKTKAYSGYSYQDKTNQAIYDMRSGCEFTTMYGSRGKVLNNVTGKHIYHSDGIVNKLTQVVDFGSGGGTVDPTVANVADMLETAFAGNSGSKKRILMHGSKLGNKLSLLPISREIGNMETAVVHGVTVKVLHSVFGDVYLKHSKTMDIAGDTNAGYVLDLANIYRHELEKMTTEKLDPDKAGIRRVQDSIRIIENACVTTRYPGTHLKWKPAS